MAPSVNGHTNGVTGGAGLKIHLYTHHDCPYAHRAHIALNELNLPFEETIIDLDTPREPWYLEINPRGLVPSMKVTDSTLKDEIITESGVVVQFLSDMHPGRLLPAASTRASELSKAALFRARASFFIDTFNSKITPVQYQLLLLDTHAEKEAKVKEWAQVFEKELEPLLADAAPFFGGSDNLTLVEVIAAPFLLRYHAVTDDKLFPMSFRTELNKLPNFSKWSARVMKHPSVTPTFDPEKFSVRIARKVSEMKAKAKQG